jgi:1-aminocyclopropane-1-carboxylate deaminase
MQEIDMSRAQVEPIQKKLYQQKGVQVAVLRLDAIHPVISGNKWFKLKEYLKEAAAQNKGSIITFGGAFSNHIVATAAACYQKGFETFGVIRGERPAQLSPTLQQAIAYGMQLHFISRAAYRAKTLPQELMPITQNAYIINEGGYGPLGAAGAATMLDVIDKKRYTHFCAAVGTGTMLAGLFLAADTNQQVLGISVLKNHLHLLDEVKGLAPDAKGALNILHDYHFGGYAKKQEALITFMNDWYRNTGILTDFVYTGKLFYAIDQLVQHDYFGPGSKLLLIHSGGLQGNASLPKGTLIF